jgi:uncharacterized protein (DUF983 family)
MQARRPFTYLCEAKKKDFVECPKCHLRDKSRPYVYMECLRAKPICYRCAVKMTYKDAYGRIVRPWWQTPADRRALTEQCPACGNFDMQVDHNRRMKRCAVCGKLEPIWGYEGDDQYGSIKESMVRKYRVT